MDKAERLAKLIRDNGGVFTRQQALIAGYSDGEVRYRVQAGVWQPLRRGVYALRERVARADEWQRHALHVAAVVAALGERTVASHHTAARLHCLVLLEPPPDAVTVTRPPGTLGRHRGGDVHLHRAALPDHHVSTRAGVPVTSVARTAVDLARALPPREGLVTIDAALHQRRTTTAALQQVLADCRGWPGSGRAARVVGFADPKAESALESLTRLMLYEQGLPAPLSQVEFRDGKGRMRVDFYWPAYRTVLEVDGMLKYGERAGPATLKEEKLRQERLAALGLEVVRYDWQQANSEQEASADRLWQAFARQVARGAAAPGAALPPRVPRSLFYLDR